MSVMRNEFRSLLGTLLGDEFVFSIRKISGNRGITYQDDLILIYVILDKLQYIPVHVIAI